MDLFPFDEVREKQEDLLRETKEAIRDERSIVAHAPTGLGKTAATLTPALEHVTENDGKVFFLTPRHSQHQIAIETVKKMEERHGENLVSVDLIGKNHLCEADVSTMGGKGPDCPRHDETFDSNHNLTDRAQRKLKELKKEHLTAEEVKERCSKVCPYHLSMQLTQHADLIIGDYFHVFHPGVREVVMEKADFEMEDAILVVDEAHNLPDRTRSLFSYSLSIPEIDRAMTEAEKFGYYPEESNLEQLKNKIRQMAVDKLSQQDHEEKIQKKDLVDIIDSFHSFKEMVVDLDAVADEVEEEREQSYCRGIAEFLDSWEGEDSGFVRCVKRVRNSGNRYIQVKYSCLDPQKSTRKPLNTARSSTPMLATLHLPETSLHLLGPYANIMTPDYSSPFPEENEMNLVIPTLTTKYEERDESMVQKYAWYLSKSFEAVPGNCGVFFPSYSFMQDVAEQLEEHTSRTVFMERRGMNKAEKQEMLDDFADLGESGNGVLLGVAAGSFGEGIDFPGEAMKGVFIVGLPLQRPDLETQELIDFLDERFGKGWDYGYSYPAMNRAIQAAGRCIRSSDDKGIIVYMDKRYNWSNYRKVIPDDKNLIETRAPWKQIDEFF
jgi:DNA excision repair protein ERCC-2